jgi:hypothetical protein
VGDAILGLLGLTLAAAFVFGGVAYAALVIDRSEDW